MHIYERKLIECLGLTYVVARNLILHCYWNIRFFIFILFYVFFFWDPNHEVREYHLISVYGMFGLKRIFVIFFHEIVNI